jgi:glycine/D-amino acid oxidase-like deaminating enzyme
VWRPAGSAASAAIARSFWLASIPGQTCSPLEGTLDVDLAIVGGGYTGLTTAFFVKQADPALRVALLEARFVGFGASGRNAGFAMTRIGMLPSLTALRFGRSRALEAHEYGVRAERLVAELVRDLRLACDYERSGYLWIATSDRQRRRLERELELAHTLGLHGVEHLDADELRERLRSPLYVGGAWWE